MWLIFETDTFGCPQNVRPPYSDFTMAPLRRGFSFASTWGFMTASPEQQEQGMANFPGQNDDLDTAAFRAATEAVIGVTLSGQERNQERVREWLETSIVPTDPSNHILPRAMYFAKRIMSGPLGPDE